MYLFYVTYNFSTVSLITIYHVDRIIWMIVHVQGTYVSPCANISIHSPFVANGFIYPFHLNR